MLSQGSVSDEPENGVFWVFYFSYIMVFEK